MSHGAGHTATGNENPIDQQPARRQVSADAFRALTLKLKGVAPPVAQPAPPVHPAQPVAAEPVPAPVAHAPESIETSPHDFDQKAADIGGSITSVSTPHQPPVGPDALQEDPIAQEPLQTCAAPANEVTEIAAAAVAPSQDEAIAVDPVLEQVVHKQEPAPVDVPSLDQHVAMPPQAAPPLAPSLPTEPVSPLSAAPQPPAQNNEIQANEPSRAPDTADQKHTTSIVFDDNANKVFERQLQALKQQTADRLKIDPAPVAPEAVAHPDDSPSDIPPAPEQEAPAADAQVKKPAETQPVADPLVAAMKLIDPAHSVAESTNVLETVLPQMPVLDNLDPFTTPAAQTNPATTPAPLVAEAAPPAPAGQKTENTTVIQADQSTEKAPLTDPQPQNGDLQIQPQQAQAPQDVSVEAITEAPPQHAAPTPQQPAETPVVEEDVLAAIPVASQPPQEAVQSQGTVEIDPKSGETARALLDMMSMPSGASQPHERSLAADTLLQLFPKMPERDLIALSERVCLMEDPPSLLVKKLINHSSAKVAQPLLEGANGIDEQDFLRLVATCDEERLLMIAKRRKVSASVCDALIVRGKAKVNLTLARNPGARFSHDAFVTLGEIAKTQPTLQAPLATRGDTPAPIAFELFWSLPTELRRYVLSRFLTDSSTLDKILKIAKNVDTAQDEQTGEVKFPSKRSVDELVELLVEGAADKSAAKMAEMAGINQENARRIIADPDGEPLTVAFKTIGLSRNQFEEALKRCISSPNVMLRPDRSATELQNLFDSLSFNKARTLITYWDWAIEKSGPYARRAG